MKRIALCTVVGFMVLASIGRVAGLAGQVRAATPAEAGGPEITLQLSDGTTVEGALRRVQPSVYLVQTAEQLVEITEDELLQFLVVPAGQSQADFLASTREAALPGERLLRYETYEVVTAKGDVDFWSHTETVNESRQVLTFLQWGAREDELPRYRTMMVYDQFGNRLAHRSEPRPGTALHNIIVDLAVPVAPGEKVSFTIRYAKENQVRKEGENQKLVFHGDFPEDRVYHRKVALPAGAQIAMISPEPWLQFEHGDRQIIVWHRYYPQGERYPLTVEYTLAP